MDQDFKSKKKSAEMLTARSQALTGRRTTGIYENVNTYVHSSFIDFKIKVWITSNFFSTHPSTIKKRFISVFFVMLISPGFLYFAINKKILEKVNWLLLMDNLIRQKFEKYA